MSFADNAPGMCRIRLPSLVTFNHEQPCVAEFWILLRWMIAPRYKVEIYHKVAGWMIPPTGTSQPGELSRVTPKHEYQLDVKFSGSPMEIDRLPAPNVLPPPFIHLSEQGSVHCYGLRCLKQLFVE